MHPSQLRAERTSSPPKDAAWTTWRAASVLTLVLAFAALIVTSHAEADPETAPETGTKTQPPPSQAPLDAPETASEQSTASEPKHFLGAKRSDIEVISAMRARPPTQFKPVGSTSVVFRMRLEGDLDAAFKPRSHSHGRGDLHEVAAYRVARALGLRSVPPAALRWVPLDNIRRLLHPEYVDRWDSLSADMIWNEDSKVRGAAIFWIPDMRDLGLDSGAGRERWVGWLSQSNPIPVEPTQQDLASQVSTMIAFDYLIANWDRFSGANAQGSKDRKNLYVRDHNLAFQTGLNDKRQRRIRRALQEVQRFSTSFVQAVRALDEVSLRAALAQTDPAVAVVNNDKPKSPSASGTTLLDDTQLAELLDRRAGLLSWVAALADRYGVDAVLCFP